MSTDRRELQEETTKTVQQDQSFNAGVSVSAGYGPFFQVTANTEFASSTSTTESARKAFTIAKEATDRTIARLSERVRRQQTTQTLEEFEETNEHGLDNTGGLDHAIGQYQWLVRRFQAQIYNYGLRLLFNFMVPEPSVFLHRAVAAGAPEGETITAPEPFHIRPNQITEGNYGRYVRDYEVTGVSPPPPLFQTLSRHANDRAEVPGADFAWGEVVTIPPGYRAWEGHATVTFIRWSTMDGSLDGEPIDETTPVIYVNIGREWWRRHTGDSHTHTFVLDDEQLQIPVSVATLWCASYTANIEILCRRDERLFEEWQIETHTAILQSYQKLQTEYEEKLAAATVQQGIRIEGRNPLENRLIERAELKKHCISLVTAQHFDKFSAILESPSSLPRIDFEEAEAEGRYIRFFEQAFEWENMTYVFYPYFWGRRSTWIDRMNLRDTDPVHAEFLKAGAARVVAPVRPGFEQAVLHFLDTGRIWAGGDLPQIGNPLYVDILDEIRERLQSPGQEVAVFEPWEVRMPTTLVRLAPGSTLPRWEQDEEGNWQPVEPSEEG